MSKKILKGRVINGGKAEGKAVVLKTPFSFIGDFDPATGTLTKGHPMEGTSIAGKILVCPTGKGGTVAPYIAYIAKTRKLTPIAILCQSVDPILALSALTIDIPILDRFDVDIISEIKTEDELEVDGEQGTVAICGK
ncbi:MAG: hypothetical protein DRN20_04915 [Thermoplasmata archaeon]|nr:MAG: hypothetical protein DRG36_06300 [Deltaproteobacteria bacterium]RLF48219.1 MAG: hypothetical protein DRN20_04915 [Thermoplasmata archaeon]